jgi:peptidyl-prolyl cis-trans isomerase A (cyclophilin A)
MKNLLAATAALLFATAAWSGNPMVEFKTNLGPITVELFADKAPATVENILQYVKEGFYDGMIFHRVIDGFMIQGGGFEAGMKEKKTRPSIPNEAKNGLKNLTGTLAMARTSDPHSAAAQFFINLKDNAFLDYPGRDGWGYAVFGKVTHGMDTVNKIAKVPTGNSGFHQNVPTTPVIIESVKLLQEKKS